MIPIAITKKVEALYNGIFKPHKMRMVIYNNDMDYNSWVRIEQLKCKGEYAYLFILKLKENKHD